MGLQKTDCLPTRLAGIVAVMLAGVLWIAIVPARAASIPVVRRVLVLYDSQAGQSPRENIGFRACQTILNHLGMIVDYRDVSLRPLPEDREMAPYRGVVTALVGDVEGEQIAYLNWLVRQGGQGRKLIVLGRIGVRVNARSQPALKEALTAVYRHLGVAWHGERSIQRGRIRYVHQEAQKVGFERPYPQLAPFYERLVPVDPALRVLLRIALTDGPDSDSAAVATGPGGGYALDGYLLWQDPLTFRRQWYVNPFVFFGQALGLEGLPAPDCTTINGLRIGFSHIDADGFGGPSRIDPGRTCADMIRQDVLERFDFPVSVSVITGEIDPAVLGSKERVDLARRIFALANVEPASHSYSHPFYWDPDDPDEAAKYSHQYGIPIAGYRHDRKAEIDGSVDYVTRHLAPPEKPCRLFFWSGNCLPTEADLAQADRLGVLNINGGDTLLDDVNNSYTSVAPIYRKVGSRYQFFTGQANENILTNLWTGPFHGFREIVTTMERTGDPYRIAPVDIYYHFYSGEYPASLKAVQTVYTWAVNQDLARLWTSEYLQVAADWLRVVIQAPGPDRFTLHGYGRCRTVRLAADGPAPDLSTSRHVLGFVRDPQGLYVSLAPAQTAELILIDPRAAEAKARQRPHLRRATGWIEAWAVTGQGLRIVYRGHGSAGWIELGGLPPGGRVQVRGDARQARLGVLPVDARGHLRIDTLQSGALELVW